MFKSLIQGKQKAFIKQNELPLYDPEYFQ